MDAATGCVQPLRRTLPILLSCSPPRLRTGSEQGNELSYRPLFQSTIRRIPGSVQEQLDVRLQSLLLGGQGPLGDGPDGKPPGHPKRRLVSDWIRAGVRRLHEAGHVVRRDFPLGGENSGVGA